jgi:hypothetical protein
LAFAVWKVHKDIDVTISQLATGVTPIWATMFAPRAIWDSYNGTDEQQGRCSGNRTHIRSETGNREISAPGQTNVQGIEIQRWAQWWHEFAQQYWKSYTREVGAGLLLQPWTELSNSMVAAGWNSSDEISDGEDSESSNEDFELRMATDTDACVSGWWSFRCKTPIRVTERGIQSARLCSELNNDSVVYCGDMPLAVAIGFDFSICLQQKDEKANRASCASTCICPAVQFIWSGSLMSSRLQSLSNYDKRVCKIDNSWGIESTYGWYYTKQNLAKSIDSLSRKSTINVPSHS